MVEEIVAKEIKILCFNLANEEFGLDVSQVLGVNPMMEIYHVPKAPDFVEGVIRIRERVIPVIDLRKRLGIATADGADKKPADGADKKPADGADKSAASSAASAVARKKRIIIAKLSGVRAGIIVDGVSSVIDIPSQNVEPPSSVLDHASLLKGVGKLEKRLLLLLDLDKILGIEEVESLAATADDTDKGNRRWRR